MLFQRGKIIFAAKYNALDYSKLRTTIRGSAVPGTRYPCFDFPGRPASPPNRKVPVTYLPIPVPGLLCFHTGLLNSQQILRRRSIGHHGRAHNKSPVSFALFNDPRRNLVDLIGIGLFNERGIQIAAQRPVLAAALVQPGRPVRSEIAQAGCSRRSRAGHRSGAWYCRQ